MKKILSLLSTRVGVVLGICTILVGIFVSAQQYTDIKVQIDPGDVLIGATGAYDFAGNFTITASFDPQVVSGTFSSGSEFFVQDLKGAAPGYYVTIESSDLSSAEGNVIAASNVEMQAAGYDVLAGQPSAYVNLGASLGSFVALDTPITLIERSLNVAYTGTLGKYGILPDLRINIPGSQPAGLYTGELTLTLTEN